jgi:DnaK suppressor protein
MKSRKVFLVKMQKVLEAERQEILARLALTAEHKNIDFDGDETDIIQARILALATAEIATRNKANLHKLETALRKISDGSFGVCDECEEEIAEKRLMTNAALTTCISCAEEIEMRQKMGAR